MIVWSDNRIIIPTLKDGAPTIGNLTALVMTGQGSYDTEVMDLGAYSEILGFLKTTASGGTNPTLDIKLQYSSDGVTFIDSGEKFDQLTTGSDGRTFFKKFSGGFGKFVRFRILLGGTASPTYTVTLKLSVKSGSGGGSGSGGTSASPTIASGQLVSVMAAFARPSDTNAYIALDAVSNSTSAPAVITLPNMARVSGGSGYIVKAQLATDQKTNTARFRLHLFNAAPTVINDNSPYLSLYANVSSRVGMIDFPACSTEDPTNSTQAFSFAVIGSANLPLSFVCNTDANLYGILETLDAFTPASAQQITIKLGVDQN